MDAYHKKIKTLPTSNGLNREVTGPIDFDQPSPLLGWHETSMLIGIMGCIGADYCKIKHGEIKI